MIEHYPSKEEAELAVMTVELRRTKRQRDRLLAAAKALLPYAKEEIRLLQHDAKKDSTYKANAMDGMKHITQAQAAIADCEEGK